MFPTSNISGPSFYRVEIPYHPNAIATSQYGSILESPISGIPSKPVFWAVTDEEYLPSNNLVTDMDALEAMNLLEWHANGYTGQSVKVAVFDVEWQGADWSNDELGMVTTHDCFAHPSCMIPIDSEHPRFGFERGVHGIACAEVIRDLAPNVDLHLVRVLGQTSLENAVDWAIREDIDFIAMSLSFFNESFYDGTGPINAMMDRLASHDVQMVTSSGNYARGHHRDTFQDLNADGEHDFDDQRGLPIYWTKGRRNIQIIWNDFQHCGHSDLNIYLWNRDGELIGKSLRQQSPSDEQCYPFERITAEIESDDWTFLTVENVGDGIPKFDIMARGGFVYQSHRDGSIVDPGTHPSVLTVGAVRVDDYLFNDVESFSSFGPTNNHLSKPEVVGPNGLSTISYGPKGFFGTSASTPAVTAALAVYKSAHPELSNREATDKIIESALSPTHFNQWTQEMGAGKVRLPQLESNPADTSCGFSPIGIMTIVFFMLRRRNLGNP